MGGLFNNKHYLFKMYKEAINGKPDSFLYVDLTSKDNNNMFYIRFEQAIQITEDD